MKDLDFEKVKLVSELSKDLFLGMGGSTLPPESIGVGLTNSVAFAMAIVNLSIKAIDTPTVEPAKHETH